ncbi:galactose-1-epimerase [Eleftheria terrae]|uniref:galactose-1-epimerase n=1 Tax=Eleftheria terrae TaxID=1597781 RepID=UPI00263AD60F|nr:galactose-1-epimerase [Eleftheria terrae]WKB53373.1 galactose-1-epimerase [Eleftheria terrae]
MPHHVLTLRHPDGLELTLMDQGATWLSCKVPCADGQRREVLLGAPDAAAYQAQTAYLGATIGRYANRIGGARISHAGRSWQLTANPGSRHQLHGGPQGFDRRRWQLDGHEPTAACLSLVSEDGDQGYPGRLQARVTYRLADARSIEMEAEAEVSAPSPVCLTQHSYFNLDARHGDVRSHRLRVPAAHYLPVDADLIPLGPLAPVAGSGFDFRQAKTLQQDWLRDEQQQASGGYDHALLIDAAEGAALQHPVAELQAGDGGLAMQLYSTLPALQVYAGQYLGGTPSRDGSPYAACAGIALEPQVLPDSPNHPEWPQPSCWLVPGQTYRQLIRWRFA